MERVGIYRGSSKDIAISVHFKRRMEERCGLKINRKARAELVKWIQAGKGKTIKKQSIARSIIEVPIFLSKELCKQNDNIKFGDKLVMVYDGKRQRLVTVLPDKLLKEDCNHKWVIEAFTQYIRICSICGEIQETPDFKEWNKIGEFNKEEMKIRSL